MTKGSNKSFWLALTLFSLIGQIAWVVENMYLNVFIYNVFNASPSDISAMVAASAISATLTTVLIGALSDRIGKRKLFMCLGYIFWGVSIFGFAFSMVVSSAALGISLVITLDCLMTFFGSSANDAAFNAWLTDSTDDNNRGAAEGVNSMMPLVAMLAVFGGFMFFDLKLASSWRWIFGIIGGVVIAIGVLGIFLIREPQRCRPSESGYWYNVLYSFRPSTVRQNLSLYINLFLFIIFNISIQIFMPYLIIYYEVSLGMTNYVLVLAPCVVLAAAVTALWGRVYDKVGFEFSSIVAVAWLAAGYLILFLFKDTPMVFIGSLLMMCGYLSGMAVFGAKTRALTPEGKAGMFQGVRIFSQVLLPGVIGPFIGSAVLANAEKIKNNDGTESFVPNANIFLAALICLSVLTLIMLIVRGRRKPRTVELTSEFENNDEAQSWNEHYPRPSMVRDSFISLSGEWELSVKRGKRVEPLGKIRVPYPPESRLSGIKRALGKNESYIYEKTFSYEKTDKRLLLHFGACDQICEVLLNGAPVGKNEGGYLPFEFDITDLVNEGENLISLTVTDRLDTEYAYGKQRVKRGGMWYTPISGIWQPVWLECVPTDYIKSIKITPTLSSVRVEVEGGADSKKISIEGVGEYSFSGRALDIEIEKPRLWTPDEPNLYYFTVSAGEDSVRSYFALRTVGEVETPLGKQLALNGKPYFFNGLLDQGYFPEGIYTPASPDAYANDIRIAKKLGFNTLRKHIKIEPEIFYYECDRLGMAVFQDMVNSGKYGFLIDTALPTLGLKRGIAHRASKKRRTEFERSAEKTLALLHNHPSVVYYTIFNEGWGQYRGADEVYDRLRSLDSTRIYDTASGWFYPERTDVDSEHVYFKEIALEKRERPLVLSEFGGYSMKIEEHSFNLDKNYGYRFFKNSEEFAAATEALYRNEIIPAIRGGLSAAILTQLTDVEDETNGLVTYDRRVVKLLPERMTALSTDVLSAFREVNCND